MLITRTLITALLVSTSLFSFAHTGIPTLKAKARTGRSSKNATAYIFHFDNTVNKNNSVDSVLVILDKYDHSGAGIVRKVFHPGADNQIVIEDLPAGKYYADIYVLGMYKQHFSTVIYTAKSVKKNKIDLALDYTDAYVPGNTGMPAENPAMFTYLPNRN